MGFFANQKLKRIEIATGLVQTVAPAGLGRGGSWSQEGVIVFTPAPNAPLWKVSAGGGTPYPLTTLDPARRELSHRHPWFLPDGRRFLFWARNADRAKSAIFLGDLQSKELKQIVVVDSNVVYLESGLILFIRNNTLMAQPFDLDRAATAGDAFPVAEQVTLDWGNGRGDFSASTRGTLAYFSSRDLGTQLYWVGNDGKGTPVFSHPGLLSFAISPNGETVAVGAGLESGTGADLWLHNLKRATSTRFTFSSKIQSSTAVWSPDSAWIVYRDLRKDKYLLVKKAVSGNGIEEILVTASTVVYAHDWSKDGRYLIYGEDVSLSEWGLLKVLPLTSGEPPFVYAPEDSQIISSHLSPNGRWLAYSSRQAGPTEVFVQSFPKPGGKTQISTQGGDPRWSPDGKRLYFFPLGSNQLSVVEVNAGERFEAGIPKVFLNGLHGQFRYDVAPDGRILTNATVGGFSPTLTVVLNWQSGRR